MNMVPSSSSCHRRLRAGSLSQPTYGIVVPPLNGLFRLFLGCMSWLGRRDGKRGVEDM